MWICSQSWLHFSFILYTLEFSKFYIYPLRTKYNYPLLHLQQGFLCVGFGGLEVRYCQAIEGAFLKAHSAVLVFTTLHVCSIKVMHYNGSVLRTSPPGYDQHFSVVITRVGLEYSASKKKRRGNSGLTPNFSKLKKDITKLISVHDGIIILFSLGIHIRAWIAAQQ